MKHSPQSSFQSPRVYVVEASAGSGKTYALARHYLKLLLDPGATQQRIEDILAITFTNKAAREMKERILELLKKIALGAFTDLEEEKRIYVTLSLDRHDARDRARLLMDYIISNYNFFQVKTIDSFVNVILMGCAWEIGLSANFKIQDDRTDYLISSLDACIKLAHQNVAVRGVFEAFLRQYLWLEEKKGWFPKSDILRILSSLFYEANVYGGSFRKFQARPSDIRAKKHKLLRLLRGFLKGLPDEVNKNFRRALERFLAQNKDAFDFADIASKKTFLASTIPVRKEGTVSGRLVRLWERIRQKTASLAEEEAASLFDCYIDIFNLVYQVLRASSKEDDVLFLDELNQQALTLIRENGVTVPELYYRLAGRLKHFLIDELQDISILQWENLFPMVEEALATSGSLFYVGDKKQAIYRFRGGEVMLFDRLKEQFSAYAQLDSLNTNFRSQQEIIEFNNAVFSPENLRRFLKQTQTHGEDGLRSYLDEADVAEILGIFAGSRQGYIRGRLGEREYGRVMVEVVECSGASQKEERIKEKFLPLVQELVAQGRFDLRDITILCRSNTEVELVSLWLIEKDIPVESEKTLNIKNNQYIKELVSLLTFLNSPINDLLFTSFLLGEIFLRSSGLSREEIEGFLFKRNRKDREERGSYIYRDFRIAYPGLWQEYLEDFFKAIGFIGVYELVTDILKRFEVFKHFPEQQGFFMHLLELIKKSEEEHPGIADFLEFFQGLNDARVYINYSDTDAVKAMTIHKAKGLGFGVVIIPFLELDAKGLGPLGNRGSVSYTAVQDSGHLSLLRLDRKYALVAPRIGQIWQQEYKKSFIDELNTIYVAFTRAQYELYIFIPHASPKTDNIARFLIPDGCFQRGQPRAYPRPVKPPTHSLLLRPPEYKPWLAFLAEEFASAHTLIQRSQIMKGEILHAILALVGDLTQAAENQMLERGLRRVASLYPAIKDLSSYQTIVEHVLHEPRLRQFFYLNDSEVVYQEKEIVDRYGITRRIDRLIIKEKEVWVVDYKTRGEEAAAYQVQLEAYLQVVREIYPQKRARGFIIFLEDARFEELHG